MIKQFFMLVLFGAVVSTVPLVKAQKGSTDNQQAKGVPEQYAGNWVCQTFQPGYNILLPHQTNPTTTPSTVLVLKFSLKTDGVYEAADSKGHYSFDSATKAITWLDGPHQKAFTKTLLGKSKNGEPNMGFVFNKRYYGCFKPKPRSK